MLVPTNAEKRRAVLPGLRRGLLAPSATLIHCCTAPPVAPFALLDELLLAWCCANSPRLEWGSAKDLRFMVDEVGLPLATC